jgi:hypothetical protein
MMSQITTRTVTFEASPDDRDANGIYTFPIPERQLRVGRVELAAFSSQAVEANITEEENVVSWHEGFSADVGEAPTVLTGGDSAGVPVFAHEICIREGSSKTAFKIGLCPRINEVSTVVWNDAGSARLGNQATGATWAPADHYFSTTRNMDQDDDNTLCYAAPHYGREFQLFKATGALSEMRFSAVGMTTSADIDLSDFDVVQFVDASPAAPTGGGTQFTLASTAPLVDAAASVTTGAVTQGFLACSPWTIDDAVAFLNWQLGRVTDSVFSASSGDAGDRFNRCHTTGARPSNRYRFVYEGARIRLEVVGDATVEIAFNQETSGNYAWHGMHEVISSGSSSTVAAATLGSSATAPTGSAAKVRNLWNQLGFQWQTSTYAFAISEKTGLGGRPGTLRSFNGVLANQPVTGAFETRVDPAHYTAATLATAISGAMNMDRAAGTAADPDLCSAGFAFIDSVGIRKTALISAGSRTPHQLAEALSMVLNRLDSRGIYAETAELFTVNEDDASLADAQGAGGYATEKRNLFYRVVYSATTGKFTVENREVDSFSLVNATTYPPTAHGRPLVQYPATVTRAPFSISFKAADIAVAASTVGATKIDTAVAARMLGFVAERTYSGTQVTSENDVLYPSYEETVSRGLRSDVSSTYSACGRPLDSAPGTSFWQNRVDFRGAGPDARVYPRFVYTINGSQYNDKKFTITASHPSVASSVSQGVGAQKNSDYSNNDLTADVTAADSNRVVTALAVNAAGTDYRTGDLVVIDDSGGTGTAVARVTASSTGAATALTVLYSGSGDVAHAATEGTSKLNAQGPLRIVDGSDPTLFTDDADAGKDVSRVVVQAAVVRDSPGVYRSTASCLPFRPGDPVILGGNASLLLGSVNLGLDIGGLVIDVTRVSDGGVILTATGAMTTGAGEDKMYSGQYYRVMQGDGGTIIRTTSTPGALDDSFTFVYAKRGTGHFLASSVQLFGPIVPHTTGVVEEVMQPNFRTVGTAANLESAYVMRRAADVTSLSGATAGPTSYHRDGSLLKIRLPFNCRYVVHSSQDSFPSNLETIEPFDPVRFQLLNAGTQAEFAFKRRDTVWHVFGTRGDTEVGRTLKMPFEWDLNAHSGIFVTLHNEEASLNHTYICGNTRVDNVMARVTYSAALARSWGVAHSKQYHAARLGEIRVRLRDNRLRDYDFNGRPFSISFNIHGK